MRRDAFESDSEVWCVLACLRAENRVPGLLVLPRIYRGRPNGQGVKRSKRACAAVRIAEPRHRNPLARPLSWAAHVWGADSRKGPTSRTFDSNDILFYTRINNWNTQTIVIFRTTYHLEYSVGLGYSLSHSVRHIIWNSRLAHLIHFIRSQLKACATLTPACPAYRFRCAPVYRLFLRLVQYLCNVQHDKQW